RPLAAKHKRCFIAQIKRQKTAAAALQLQAGIYYHAALISPIFLYRQKLTLLRFARKPAH
ncbi:hypothetical protein Q0P47_13890, partial [Staphylococcus aureus]|nr:hypothetical protein [Staphylococcus aureus]